MIKIERVDGVFFLDRTYIFSFDDSINRDFHLSVTINIQVIRVRSLSCHISHQCANTAVCS